MTLKRNPYYWKQGEDGKALPYLDELEFQIIPDDATRLLKLKAGEIDGTEFVPYARVQELKTDPSLRMELWPSTRVAYLTMNVRPTLKDGKPNPLSNVKVRQALNYAINKDAIIQITTLGLGKPMQSFMSSTTPLYLSDRRRSIPTISPRPRRCWRRAASATASRCPALRSPATATTPTTSPPFSRCRARSA